jgi:ribosomal protein S27AE
MNVPVFLLFLLVAVGVYWYTKRKIVEAQKKKCPNCGAMAKLDAKTCPQCGRDLT